MKPRSRLLLLPMALVLGCSTVPPSTGTSASAVDTANSFSAGSGDSSGRAVGDVQNGPIQIFNVRVAPQGADRFYANPGGLYRVDPQVPVEFWVEWRADVALAAPPRLIIRWGFTEADNVGCGSCLLTRAFPQGLHTVTVTLDDRAGGTTSRTFQIDARPRSTGLPGVGQQGRDGVVEGDSWIVCRADESTAWVAANNGGTYLPTTACRALGYRDYDRWGGTCGRVCGYCESPNEIYDSAGGSGASGAPLSHTVHWRCAR